MLYSNGSITKDLRESADKIRPLNNEIASILVGAANKIEALEEDVRLYKTINEAHQWHIYQQQNELNKLKSHCLIVEQHMCGLCKECFKDKKDVPSCEGCHLVKGGEE